MATIRKRKWAGGTKSAWQVSYTDTKGKRRTKSFDRKKEAEAWLVQAEHDVARGVHMPDSQSLTVADAVDLWLRTPKADGTHKEPATLRSYESTARLHIVPFLGGEKLSRLNKPSVEKFRRDLIESGRSPARVQRAVRYLSMLLAEAESQGLVGQNAASNVKVVRSSRDATEVEIPTPAELKLMIKHSGPALKPLVLCAMLAALRASELRGLMWEHVDFAAGVIRVVQRAEENNKLGAPKSKAGRRSVPMSPLLMKEMKEWKLRCPKNLLGLVFPSPDGMIWRYQNLMRRSFWPMQIAAGVSRPVLSKDDGLPVWDEEGREVLEPKYGLHALRHGAASLWIKQGIDLKRLKAWMGHASVQVTIDTYGHLMFDDVADAELVAGAERALLG
ncbi:MAG TPA: tyrosine-type recombinase/integrase [Allosphingosinicella sp.]|jgi:integrase